MEIRIEIKIEEGDLPTLPELNVRYRVEDLIMERDIGDIIGAGAGFGIMDISAEVFDEETAVKAIQDILREFQIENISTISIVK